MRQRSEKPGLEIEGAPQALPEHGESQHHDHPHSGNGNGVTQAAIAASERAPKGIELHIRGEDVGNVATCRWPRPLLLLSEKAKWKILAPPITFKVLLTRMTWTCGAAITRRMSCQKLAPSICADFGRSVSSDCRSA